MSEQRGHFVMGFGRLSDASKIIAPRKGVKKRLQKKYPQNPNFLLAPSKAIMTLNTRYIGAITMLYSLALRLDDQQSVR